MSKIVTAAAGGVAKKSQIQRHILSLYRQMLRAAKDKDDSIATAVKSEFRANRDIPRKEILRVEFHVRKAEKDLKLIKSANVKSVRADSSAAAAAAAASPRQ